MPRQAWSMCVVVLLLSGGVTSAAAPQGMELGSRGPRFTASWAKSGEALDVSSSAVLRRRVSLDLTNVTADEALKEITRQADLEISYRSMMLPSKRSVSVHAREITVAAALTEVLLEAEVDVVVTRGEYLALVERPRSPTMRAPASDSGTVSGRVIDKATATPIVGATVVIEGTSYSVTTESDGRYLIPGVPMGTHRVRVRYIGYAPAVASITVRPGFATVADFTLEKSVQKLDEVVTTGTTVPTEVRALPAPITVIHEDEVALQRPTTVQEVFRQAVPASVSWNLAAAPFQTAFSARGASTLAAGLPQMKVLVDGMEAAGPLVAPIDPASIQRIEVIRGPQAAAIYGSDAVGGVIQIFTKRGDSTLKQPQVSLEAALGAVQTPYDGFDGVLRQSYGATVRGSRSDVSYNLGAGYSRTDDYLPAGEISRQSNPSAYVGMRYGHGILSLDVSGRYYIQNSPNVFEPALFESGFAPFSQPNYQPTQVQNQTIGVQVSVAPATWWQHTITLGVDRFNQELLQSQPRRTTPDDTLLFVFEETRTKRLLGYRTSIHGHVARATEGSFTAGLDHYSLPVMQSFTFGALNTEGAIQTVPGLPFAATRTSTNNTGYFAQGQVGFRDRLFLTGGIRAEENTHFGDSLGLPVSPRAGVSFLIPRGRAMLKLRASYGRAIRAPAPGQKLSVATPTSVTLANPNLGPERQRGWDAGADLLIGAQASLSVSYYDQTADNLIDQVKLPDSFPTFQYQNVGRVRNSGIEVEGSLFVGPVQVKGQYGYARSRVESLPAGYTGDIRVGDQSLFTPKHTAGATLSLAPQNGTVLAAGFSYVGSWTNYDLLALYRCFGGTGPCLSGESGLRDYLIEYPGFVKVKATLWQQIARHVVGFVSVDNLTNSDDYEFSNAAPVLGRITTVGLRVGQ